MHHIQELMTPQRVKEPDGTNHVMGPIIQPKFATAAKCVVPFCESCLLSRYKKRSPGVAKKKAVPEKMEFYLVTSMKSEISCQPINFCLRLLEESLQDLLGSYTTIDFTSAPFIMMLPLD